MKPRRGAGAIGVGLVLAGSLAVASAGSTALTANLVRNAGAELGRAAKDSHASPGLPEWKRTGRMTAVEYVDVPASFPRKSISRAIKGGKNFFAGGPDNARSSAKQTVDVAAFAARIDTGTVKAVLSGWLGGYEAHTDVASVDAVFRSATGKRLGSLRIGPVTAEDRGDVTRLLKRTATGTVPKETRTVDVVVRAIRGDGGAYNDGYADNVSLRLG